MYLVNRTHVQTQIDNDKIFFLSGCESLVPSWWTEGGEGRHASWRRNPKGVEGFQGPGEGGLCGFLPGEQFKPSPFIMHPHKLSESYFENFGRYALGFQTLPSGDMGKQCIDWHQILNTLHCQVMKTDDDMYVNLPLLKNHLQRAHPRPHRLITGCVKNGPQGAPQPIGHNVRMAKSSENMWIGTKFSSGRNICSSPPALHCWCWVCPLWRPSWPPLPQEPRLEAHQVRAPES